MGQERQHGEWWGKRKLVMKPTVVFIKPEIHLPSFNFVRLISFSTWPEWNFYSIFIACKDESSKTKDDDDLPTQASWILSIPLRSVMTSILEWWFGSAILFFREQKTLIFFMFFFPFRQFSHKTFSSSLLLQTAVKRFSLFRKFSTLLHTTRRFSHWNNELKSEGGIIIRTTIKKITTALSPRTNCTI